MDEITTGGDKNKVLEFAEGHPYVLLGAIGVLIIVIVVMFMGGRGYGTGGVKKKKAPENEDEEVDVLIESIHDKQKSKD